MPISRTQASVYRPWKIIALCRPSLFLLQNECFQLDLWRQGTICEKYRDRSLESWLPLIFGQTTELLSLGLRGVGLMESCAWFSISLVLSSCVKWSSSLHLQMLINIPSWVFQSFRVFSILGWCGLSSQQPTVAGGSCQAVSTTWTHPWPGCSATTSCEEGLVYREECQGKGFPPPSAWVCVYEGGRALTTWEEDGFLIFLRNFNSHFRNNTVCWRNSPVLAQSSLRTTLSVMAGIAVATEVTDGPKILQLTDKPTGGPQSSALLSFASWHQAISAQLGD